MGVKPKRCILMGRERGNSTPSPTWRLGCAQPDGSLLQVFTFPTTNTTLSARKLGANLWEVQSHLKVVNTGASGLRRRRRHKSHEPPLPKEMAEHLPGTPQEQVAADCEPVVKQTNYDNELVEIGRTSTKTSSGMRNLLNKIWSLEERHASNVSLVEELESKLESSQAQIKELLQDKAKGRKEIKALAKLLIEDKVAIRSKEHEHDRIKDAVFSARDALEDERKLRKHYEIIHCKLDRELSEMKLSLAKVLKEFERERKTRIMLENLCDEFSKGIRDYEQEVRLLRNKPEKNYWIDHKQRSDRLILHVSEAWLDERMQTKLADDGPTKKNAAAVKLGSEIEAFLRSRQQSVRSENIGSSSSEKANRSRLRRHSLESFHLHESSSAPRIGNDDEDSLSAGDYWHCFELRRGYPSGEGMHHSNTLKEKLLEARMESWNSRSRDSRC